MISEMFKCGQICIILKYDTFPITEGFLHCKGSSLPPDTHGSARQEKVPSEDSDSAGMQTPYGLASAHLVSLHPFSSSRCLSLRFLTFMAFIPHPSRSSHLPFLAFHPSVPLYIAFHPLAQFVRLLKTIETTVQLSCLPDSLFCSVVLWMKSNVFTFPCYGVFPEFFPFCLIPSCLNSVSTATCNCVQCLPHRNHIINTY